VFRLIYCSLNADAISAVGRGSEEDGGPNASDEDETRWGAPGGRVCARDEENAINCRSNVCTANPSTLLPTHERSRLPCGFQKFHTLPNAPSPLPPRAVSLLDPSFRFTASLAQNYSDNALGRGSFVPGYALSLSLPLFFSLNKC